VLSSGLKRNRLRVTVCPRCRSVGTGTAALLVAPVALWRKAPFLVVVMLGADTVALLRYLGWG